MWRHIQVKKNREVLTLLILMTATVIGGGWTAYMYLSGHIKPVQTQPNITAPGGVAAGTISGGQITVNNAPAEARTPVK